MDMETCECVGICKTDDKGHIIKIEREYFQQGWIFKDWGAFRNSMDAPCYVPELDDTVYTKKDFAIKTAKSFLFIVLHRQKSQKYAQHATVRVKSRDY